MISIPTVKCLHCNKEFQQWCGDIKKSHHRKKFCSKECRYSNSKKDITGYKACLFCAVSFPYRDSLTVRGNGVVKSVNSKFCSRACCLRHISKDNDIQLKRRQKLKGKPGNKNKRSDDTRLKISLSQRGEKHWNWKGGISPLNNSLRSCIEFKEWRRKVFSRDNYTCVLCNYTGNKLEADHIKSFAKYQLLRFDVDNGRTLCKKCHSETPNYKGRQLKEL